MPIVTCTWGQAILRDGEGSEIYYVDADPVVTFLCRQNNILYKLSPSVGKATFLAQWPKAQPCIDIK